MESVLNQDYKDIEYIVVDPGSTDGSRDIIDSYGSKVIKIYDKDGGPSDGLNKGFSVATGDIYYFINSDDYLLPNILSDVNANFLTNKKIDFILYGGLQVNEFGRIDRKFYPSKLSPKDYVNGAVTFFQQGLFFKAELYKKSGGFNKWNKSCWDGELLLKFLMLNAKYKRVMKCVAAFRIYPDSITGSQRFADQFKKEHLRMFEMIYGEGAKPVLFWKIIYRIKKIFADPVYIFKRLTGLF
jgi:glycosyltransferase involved in cell wall biosynthesis